MSFQVAAEAYDRYIGRYSRLLAPRFLEFAELPDGPVLEIGCGPGGLTSVLAERFGATNVSAVEPSEPFVAACRARVPGADVRLASGEQLPFDDASFTGAVAQLVLSFVRDPDRMIREAVRVARPAGVVATCMFEANGFALVRTFWDAALRFDTEAPDDASLPFRRMQELEALWGRGKLQQIATETIHVEATYSDFEDFWSPFAFGIGPAGVYLKSQPEERRQAIRDACNEILGTPTGSFSLPATVLAIRGVV